MVPGHQFHGRDRLFRHLPGRALTWQDEFPSAFRNDDWNPRHDKWCRKHHHALVDVVGFSTDFFEDGLLRQQHSGLYRLLPGPLLSEDPQKFRKELSILRPFEIITKYGVGDWERCLLAQLRI